MSTRKRFDKDFKLQAIKMVEDDGLSKSEVARRLGVDPTSISNWIKEFKVDGSDAFPGNGKRRPLEEELRKLRQENRELRMETEFLKKSAAYFASLKK
jgi:transposase